MGVYLCTYLFTIQCPSDFGSIAILVLGEYVARVFISEYSGIEIKSWIPYSSTQKRMVLTLASHCWYTISSFHHDSVYVNRTHTLVVYLTTVSGGGGETIFPRLCFSNDSTVQRRVSTGQDGCMDMHLESSEDPKLGSTKRSLQYDIVNKIRGRCGTSRPSVNSSRRR